MNKHSRIRKIARLIRACSTQFADPFQVASGLRELPHFIQSAYRYSRLTGAEPIRALDLLPQLHDRTEFTRFDAHYFYMGAWATRRIIERKPKTHVDIGGHVFFISTLTAVTPVVFVDYRPLRSNLSGFVGVAGDIRSLPFADDSLDSLSCLHVAEHIGLGRYGDPLDARGTHKAMRELGRVLAPGGNLLFALPIGRERLCFNAHRVHAPATITEGFSGFDLVEFSGVHDDGTYVERASLQDFRGDEYGCGLYWFRKPR